MENEKYERISQEQQAAPEYEPPKVISLSKDELVAELGPARACTSYIYGDGVKGLGG